MRTMIDPASLLSNPTIGTDCEPVREYVRGRSFHVTGGGGTIGLAVVSVLLEYGATVTAIDRDEGRLAMVPDGAARRLHDIADGYSRRQMFGDGRPNAIIHAAAYKHVDGLQNEPCAAIHNNIDATRNVAEYCAGMGCRMVYLSTDKAINPVGVLGLTKALGEHVARSVALATVVRLVNVIGSSGSVIERWVKQIDAGQPPTVCNPSHQRHYVSERHAAHVVLSALLAPDRTNLIPAEYETISTGELCDRLLGLYGRVPGEYIITGDRPGERSTEPVIPEGEWAAERYGLAYATRSRDMAVVGLGGSQDWSK